MSWQCVREEFESLLSLSQARRETRLSELESTDAGLARELRRLLAHDAEASRFLEREPQAFEAPAGSIPALAAEAPGTRFGRFELVRFLASGGMGSVWEARQTDPERRVALKLVPRSPGSPRARWRFQHEVAVLARLNHPSIATFHEAGSEERSGVEIAWLAMELVEGARDLLSHARGEGLALEARLELFDVLCAAVEHGHRRGVLHRDLKPGNVLVGADGRLKLIDFGVAKALESEGPPSLERTGTGDLVGTLQYMAPEQISGRADQVGTASDVYALGVILYHLICERPPLDFSGAGLSAITQAVLEREPLAPTQARPGLPRELEWILLHCLEKQPERRYPTVEALRDDLGRYREHRPLRAGPPGAAYRLRKFLRRNRVAAGIGLALAAGVGAGAFGLWRGAEQARAGERAARRGFEVTAGITRVLTGLFEGVDETAGSKDLRVHELLDSARFDQALVAEPVVEFSVRELRGRMYGRLHEPRKARQELERALELFDAASRTPGIDWRGRKLALEAALGDALVEDGQAARGEELLRAAVREAEVFGDPVVRLAVLREFCEFLARKGRHAELKGEALLAGRLAREQGLASVAAHADLWFADAASGLDQHEQALPAAKRALEAGRELWGPEGQDTLAALHTYVSALQLAGRLDEAEALYPELIESVRALYGPKDDRTLTVLNNHCELLFRRGKPVPVETMAALVAAADARGAPADENHAAMVGNLGMTLYSKGRLAEALPHLRRAAELSRTLMDPADPNGAALRFNHGACLAGLKRWSEAEPILLAEYEFLAGLLPADHQWLPKFRRTIADAYGINGHDAGARLWRER